MSVIRHNPVGTLDKVPLTSVEVSEPANWYYEKHHYRVDMMDCSYIHAFPLLERTESKRTNDEGTKMALERTVWSRE